MESLGKVLQKAREAKSLTVKDIEMKTHISEKNILALENEEYDSLPGEVYIKGFLRNIALALELDPNEIVDLYVRTKRSEEPAPYEDLLKDTKKQSSGLTPMIVTALVLLVALTAAIIVFIVISSQNNDENGSNRFESAYSQRTNFITEKSETVNVRSGDVIVFRPVGVKGVIRIKSIDNVLEAVVNGSELVLTKDNPFRYDLNNNGTDDFKMSLIDIVEDTARVELSKLEEKGAVKEDTGADTETDDAADEEEVQERRNESEKPIGPSSGVSVVGDIIYVYKNIDKKNISVSLTAKGIVYMRYFIDNERPETETLYAGKEIDLGAEDTIVLNIGNAGQVETKINGKTVPLGREGETISKVIKWHVNINDVTKYDLIVTDIK